MRVKILMRLFLNADSWSHFHELAHDFGASPGHVRSELIQLSGAGLLMSEKEGRQVRYRADRSHPLFPELQSMVRKALGMNQVVESIVVRLGKLKLAYLAGDYAEGRDSGIVDLIPVGNINKESLADLVAKTERIINRRTRVPTFTEDECEHLKHTLRDHAHLL